MMPTTVVMVMSNDWSTISSTLQAASLIQGGPTLLV